MQSAVYPLVHEKLPFRKYIELPGEHSTALRRMLTSPLEYQHYKKAEREETDALVIGRAAHTATLEMPQFLREYALQPDDIKVRRGAAWDKFEADNAGKTILRDADYTLALAIAERIRAHKKAGPLFAGPGRNELSIQWRHESGALCKARLDRFTAAGDLIDLKTTADLTPEVFEAQSYRKYGYHVQAAFYLDAARAAGLDAKRVVIVCASKKEPIDVLVRPVDAALLDEGREAYERALQRIAECTASGDWPGMSEDEEVPLKLPPWAMKFDEESIDLGAEVIQ
jgi:hypothetical protein